MSGALGKVYADGETIISQGDSGDCMFVIQEGQVEVVAKVGGREVRLAVRGTGEFMGEARVLTIDKKNFMSRIHEDPSVAFRLVQTLSRRVRELSEQVARLKGST
jgi:CRP-like cAMP-binding protein